MTRHEPRGSRSSLRSHLLVAVAAAASLLAACDDASPSEEDGEAIAGATSFLIQGSVQTPTAQVALAWNSYSGPTSGVLVTVSSDGSYALEATEAPPSYAFDSSLKRMLADENLPDPHIAEAVVVGLSAGADAAALDASSFESLMVGAMVVYVDEPLDRDSFAGKLYGPLGRGYHLLTVLPGPTRSVWAKNGEVCDTDDDDRCGPDEVSGSSGMSVDGWLVPTPFAAAPPLTPAEPNEG